MRKILLALAAIVVLGAAVFIATADTKETKAKKAYASAQEFVAKGDEPRAMISLAYSVLSDSPDSATSSRWPPSRCAAESPTRP